MERITITISSDLFDDNPKQEASIRPNVSIHALIQEICREFSLPEGNYAIYNKDTSRALPLEQTIDQLGVQTGSELVFRRERRTSRIGRAGAARTGKLSKPAFLREMSTQKIFPVAVQTAIIGRAGSGTSLEPLAVDLSDMAEARTVSRRHALISERKGTYFFESLAEHNLAQLNGEPLEVGERRSLKHGDELLIGKVALTFNVEAEDENGPTWIGQ